jgi:hypothetical protein
MKKLTERYKQILLEQSRDFYYQTCFKAAIAPILVGIMLSEVKPKFIHLRNSKGTEVMVRYTSTFLFVELSGKEYSQPIRLPKTK